MSIYRWRSSVDTVAASCFGKKLLVMLPSLFPKRQKQDRQAIEQGSHPGDFNLQCPGLCWHIEHRLILAVSLIAGTAAAASHRENMFFHHVLCWQIGLRNTSNCDLVKNKLLRGFYPNNAAMRDVCFCHFLIKGGASAVQSLSHTLHFVIIYSNNRWDTSTSCFSLVCHDKKTFIYTQIINKSRNWNMQKHIWYVERHTFLIQHFLWYLFLWYL